MPRDTAAKISVIVPALNEAARLPMLLPRLLERPGVEAIVVDGRSDDDTAVLAGKLGARVIERDRHRAAQMNAGAAIATGELLLFLHADTLPPRAFDSIVRAALRPRDIAAGAFRFQVDLDGWRSRWMERLVEIRASRLGLPYGDQGLFLRAATFRALGGFARLPIMEDLEFVRRLRRRGRVVVSEEAALTSGRRWEHRGFWRTMATHQFALMAYAAGIPPKHIARWAGRCRQNAS